MMFALAHTPCQALRRQSVKNPPRTHVPLRRRAVTTSLMVAVLVGTAACGNAGSARAPDATAPSASAGEQGAVTIKTFDFEPNPVRVEAGTTVTWTNKDEILHNVTSGERDEPDGTFAKQLDGPGSVAEHTFDTPGTYAYHCSIHPGMDGVVVVS